MIRSTKRARRTPAWVSLLVATALIAVAGVGCSKTDNSVPSQLAYRQQLLADWFLYTMIKPPPTSSEDCTTFLAAGTDAAGDAAMIRQAVIDSVSWDVICLMPGTYSMGMHNAAPVQATIAVSRVSNLTIKGIGASVDDVVLDFDGQTDARGFDVSTPGFWIENMWIKNTAENGVEVKATNSKDNPNVFRKLRVSWDAGSVTANGAYSIYPTRSQYIIAEFSEVEGASDAGLYIGQVEHGIVRLNYVHGNVAGLEVENSYDVEVYGNAVTDNTGGILALQEPGLTRLTNDHVLIRNNDVYGNDRDNFASGGAVANVPPGTGMMAFSGQHIEFRDNNVEDNRTTGLLIVSNVALELIERLDNGGNPFAPFIFPDGYYPYPQSIYETGNTYTGNGNDPDPLISGLLGDPPPPLPPTGWDGFISDGMRAFNIVGEDEMGDDILVAIPEVFDPEICVESSDPAYFAIVFPDPKHADLDFECVLEPLPHTEFP